MTPVHTSEHATRGEAMTRWAAAHGEVTIALETLDGGRWRIVVEGRAEAARDAPSALERRKRAP